MKKITIAIGKYAAIAFAMFLFALLVQNTSILEGKLLGNNEKSPLREKGVIANAIDVQKAFRHIYHLYKDSVVSISTEQTVRMRKNPFFQDPFFRDFFGRRRMMPRKRKQKRTGLGTGFVLSKDGYIATNHHVISRVDKITVKIGNESYKAKIVGSDRLTDLALLKINPKNKLKPVYFGNSDKVQVGDWAIAIGNPFGLDRTFTVGVVSATVRKDLQTSGRAQNHIQTDASINPGNSGGPLINIYGEVIGINRMIYSKSGGYMGIGFAIPMNTAKNILEQLKKHKKVKRGFLGVQIVPFTKAYAKNRGLKNNKGALVGAVIENSPAAKAGVRVEDIIIRVKKTKIDNFRDLISVVEKIPIGKTVRVTVLRGKEKITLFVTVTERPKDK